MSVKIGIIGIGNMGSAHAANIVKGEIPGMKLTAVADIDPKRIELIKANLPSEIECYSTAEELIASGKVNAVLIATPHYDHPPLTKAALAANLHVMCEKPAGVYTAHVREMNEAAAASDRVFAIMFNQRTDPLHCKIKKLVDSGEIGEIRRTNYIITTWLRTQDYYNSGGWRASWAGEGGGVLLNQCPHNLDLWQWICGMPKRVRAFCAFGKYHNIEVEDDVTAFVEYDNGATGVFVTTTGEEPGVNRLEIIGDRGSILLENGKVSLTRLNDSVTRIIRESQGFYKSSSELAEISVDKPDVAQHVLVLRSFVAAINGNGDLVAQGDEGINSLTLSNAMLLSTWTDGWVDLPIDEAVFLSELEQRIANSNSKKKASSSVPLDISKSV